MPCKTQFLFTFALTYFFTMLVSSQRYHYFDTGTYGEVDRIFPNFSLPNLLNRTTETEDVPDKSNITQTNNDTIELADCDNETLFTPADIPTKLVNLSDFTNGAIVPVYIGEDCKTFNVAGYLTAASIVYATEHVNEASVRDADGTKQQFGFDIRNSCDEVQVVMGEAMQMLSLSSLNQPLLPSEKSVPVPANYTQARVSMVSSIVSDRCVIASTLVSVFNAYQMPIFNVYEQADQMSEDAYPWLLHDFMGNTVAEALTLVKLISAFNWSYVGIVTDDGGNQLGGDFLRLTKSKSTENQICVINLGNLDDQVCSTATASTCAQPQEKPSSLFINPRRSQEQLEEDERLKGMQQVVSVIQNDPLLKVVVLAMSRDSAKTFLNEAYKQNVSGITWVATTSWAMKYWKPEMWTNPVLNGAIGISRSLLDSKANAYLTDLVQSIQRLLATHPWTMDLIKECNKRYGDSRCNDIKWVVFKMYETRLFESNALFNAFESIRMLRDSMNSVLSNSSLRKLSMAQLRVLLRDNFQNNTNNSLASTNAAFDIVNMQYTNESVERVLVGQWHLTGAELSTMWQPDKIRWNTGQLPVAHSASPCQPGTYMVSGHLECTWKCMPCMRDSISQTSNAQKCTPCNFNQFANENRTECNNATYVDRAWVTSQYTFIAAHALHITLTTVLFICWWFVAAYRRHFHVLLLACILCSTIGVVVYYLPKNPRLCYTMNFLSQLTVNIQMLILCGIIDIVHCVPALSSRPIAQSGRFRAVQYAFLAFGALLILCTSVLSVVFTGLQLEREFFSDADPAFMSIQVVQSTGQNTTQASKTVYYSCTSSIVVDQFLLVASLYSLLLSVCAALACEFQQRNARDPQLVALSKRVGIAFYEAITFRVILSVLQASTLSHETSTFDFIFGDEILTASVFYTLIVPPVFIQRRRLLDAFTSKLHIRKMNFRLYEKRSVTESKFSMTELITEEKQC